MRGTTIKISISPSNKNNLFR